MKRLVIFLMAMAIVLGVSFSTMAASVVIDFDEPSFSGREFFKSWNKDGYEISAITASRMNPGYDGGFYTALPEHSSPFLVLTDASSMLLTREDGKRFNLLSFDCAAWYGQPGERMALWGYRDDSKVVDESFSIGTTAMKEVVPGKEWRDLDSVRFVKGAFFDNISVTSTPVPAALWLFGSGIVGLVAVKRKKIKN